MKWKHSIFLFVACVSTQGFVETKANAATKVCSMSEGDIQREITQQGAQNTIESIYSNPKRWDSFLKCIASGDHDWIEIAVKLKPAADAGWLEGLINALGEAIGNNPSNVLTDAVPTFSLDEICSSIDVDDPRFDSYKLAINEIDRRKRALGNLKISGLLEFTGRCDADLEKQKENIARFYQVRIDGN